MRTHVALFGAGFFAAAWPWSFWRCSARSWYAVVIVVDRARTALAKLAARMAAVQGAEPEQAPRRRATVRNGYSFWSFDMGNKCYRI